MNHESGVSSVLVLIGLVFVIAIGLFVAPRIHTLPLPDIPPFNISKPKDYTNGNPTGKPTLTPTPTVKKNSPSPTSKPGSALGTATTPSPIPPTDTSQPVPTTSPLFIHSDIKVTNNSNKIITNIAVLYCRRSDIPQSSRDCTPTSYAFNTPDGANSVWYTGNSVIFNYFQYKISSESNGDPIKSGIPYTLQGASLTAGGATFFSQENWVQASTDNAPRFEITIP